MSARLPNYSELPVRAGAPAGSSWGLWGDDDVLGTLNLATPERAAAGAALVQRGAVFNLNLELELPSPPLYRRSGIQHEVKGSGLTLDDELSGFNTQSSTQWDGFRHVRHRLHGNYNGLESEDHGVHHWARKGIVTRGVLADVGRWREGEGRPLRVGESDVIEPEEVLATLASHELYIEPGDILLIRTGWVGWYRGLDEEARLALADQTIAPSCGLSARESTAAMLWDLHIAAVGTDTPAFEVVPFGGVSGAELGEALRDPERSLDVFLHFRILGLLGIPIGEMWDLEALSEDCAADGVYDFLLTSAPLNLLNGVGSPANALAVK
jgi:kynurenine formamidase